MINANRQPERWSTGIIIDYTPTMGRWKLTANLYHRGNFVEELVTEGSMPLSNEVDNCIRVAEGKGVSFEWLAGEVAALYVPGDGEDDSLTEGWPADWREQVSAKALSLGWNTYIGEEV